MRWTDNCCNSLNTKTGLIFFTILLHPGMAKELQQQFPQLFSPTFPWSLSNSLIFSGFPDKWSPCNVHKTASHEYRRIIQHKVSDLQQLHVLYERKPRINHNTIDTMCTSLIWTEPCQDTASISHWKSSNRIPQGQQDTHNKPAFCELHTWLHMASILSVIPPDACKIIHVCVVH